MANLYWKKDKKILAATETPFKTEEELEHYLLDTRGILSDIYILNRQVRARAVSGIEIPDMIGVDSEGTIVIIENKNIPVDEKIISQVLNIHFFTDGKKMKGVESFRGEYGFKWGRMYINSNKDLNLAYQNLEKSFGLINKCIKENRKTGWYAEID